MIYNKQGRKPEFINFGEYSLIEAAMNLAHFQETETYTVKTY